MNSLPTLFARTNTGAIQQWTVEVEDNKYRTVFGQVDGKIQTTEWTVCKPKNSGKANSRTAQEQAQSEAASIWKKKVESGYFEEIQQIDDTLTFVKPMLAKSFEEFKDKTYFPVYSQPKLDGIRCIASIDGLFTRTGKQIISCYHIMEVLYPLFSNNPDLVLDGELYSEQLSENFNEICSIVKKTNCTEKDCERAKTIQYWIYDKIDKKDTFLKRYEWLIVKTALLEDTGYIKLVDTTRCDTIDKLDSMYEEYLQKGFEGQMIRTDSKYEHKRSKNLLKRKEFMDNEYEILDVIEGEGNKRGVAGSILFENEYSYEFNSNIKGDRSFLKSLWENRESLKGKKATVKFFNLTPDNKIPRFPYVVAIRDYE